MKYLVAVIMLAFLGLSSANTQSNTWKLYDYHNNKDVELNVHDYTSVDEARQIIEDIIEVIGLQPKFEIKEANIPNAAAVIYGSKRYVLYNSNFIEQLNKIAGNKWASVSILAHEIGHHLNGHTLQGGGSKPAIELEADEFSGFVLRKMGASLAQAQLAMKVAASKRASHTHPAQNDRLLAIANGWNSANKQMTGSNENIARRYEKNNPSSTRVPAKPAPQTTTSVRTVSQQTALHDKYISRYVFINNSNFYITTRNNFVRVVGEQVEVLGKLAASKYPGFPFVIVGNDNKMLLVKKDGNIFDTKGNRIGYLKNNG